MYWSVIACAYYYVLCRKITDFTPVKKVIQAVFFFVTLLIIMQCFGLDTLLNFNQKDTCVLGTIGNKMVLGSFVCVLAPFLVFNRLNLAVLVLIALISGSTGTMLAVFAGLGYLLWVKTKWGKAVCLFLIICATLMALKQGDIYQFNRYGRLPVWKRTVELVAKHPQGYGVATYRLLFPIMSQDIAPCQGADMAEWEYDNTTGKGLAWRRAHNSFVQLPFEVGIPGMILFSGFLISVIWKIRNPLVWAGIIVVGVNMLTAFPERMTQSVLILIMFLAMCKGEKNV
jgi:O-antigen ligase